MKMLSIVRPLAIASAFLACGLAQAAPFQNGSFETGPAPGSFITLSAGDTSITGWTVDTGNIDYIGTYWQNADGERSIDMVGTQLGSISQTFDTNIGWLYTVQFAMAGNPAGGLGAKTMKVLAGSDSQDFSFPGGQTQANMGWETKSFQFTALAAQTTLSFQALDGLCCYGAALDNVSVEGQENHVPEPASGLLLGLSLAGLGWSRRIRQHTAG